MSEIILNTEKQKLNKFNIGGKAKNLLLLDSLKINVPKWAVITSEYFINKIPLDILKHNDLKQVEDYINTIQLSNEILESINTFFSDATYLAVRSSAVDEDSESKSFAGQFESFLYVKKENVEEYVKKVWLSNFSERVTLYSKCKFEERKPISVIIQKMINAESSGVAFGINPVSGRRSQKLISCVFGLGEGLVSGELVSDNFLVSRNNIDSTIANKTNKVIFCESKRTKQCELDDFEKNSPSLKNTHIIEISEILDKLFLYTKKYQDIEFAIEKNNVYLLQTRPITTLVNTPNIDGKKIIWDNSNIIESYPGLTSPLTYSFIVKMYDGAYRQLLSLLGVKNKTIEENSEVFKNMLGLIKGRVYYNLYSWYKLLSLLPGFSVNAEFMEKMMGVKERFELDDFKKKSKFRDYLSIIYMAYNMIKNLIKLKSETRKFEKHFENIISEYTKYDFDKLNIDETIKLYLAFEKRLLSKWKPPLVNDFFAMIFFGMLHKNITKNNIGDENTHNKLLCGAKDIISSEPAKLVAEITNKILSNNNYKKLFTEKNIQEILIELKNTNYNEICELIDSYIDKFGDRTVGELKLETITYKQNPSDFIQIIKSYIENNLELKTNSNIDTEMRLEAEKEINLFFKRKPIKKFFFNLILSKTRILVSNRENLRFYRTRGYGMVRKMFCALGDKFFAEGIINKPRDIFWLTQDEIFNFYCGKSPNFNLVNLIEYRKKEYNNFEISQAPDNRFTTYSTVCYNNSFKSEIKSCNISNQDIKGIGCCPGIVKAPVRVVRDPKEISALNNEILVTSSTDPGWITLFPSSLGILVERGSLLSHSAIVSREMGIPCIVSITDLLEKLKTGDIVEMNGSTGSVIIIEKCQN